MEKFAIDLDKVLDEFEFNEDRAEKITSFPIVTSRVRDEHDPYHSKLPSQISSDAHQVLGNTRENDSAPDEQTVEISNDDDPSNTDPAAAVKDNICKTVTSFGSNGLSVNLYSREMHFDEKILRKPSVDAYNNEPGSLTIRNDLTHTTLRKNQNETSDTQIQNSYDKKINQPTIKPSVSNLFSSLNEYINASGVSLDRTNEEEIVEDINTEEKKGERQQNDNSIIESVSSMNISMVTPSAAATSVEFDESDRSVKSLTKKAASIPPEYQNILLPVKLGIPILEDTSAGTDCDAEAPNLSHKSKEKSVYPNATLPTVANRVKEAESIIDRPEHVYENVYIGTDILKSQDLLKYASSKKGITTTVVKNQVEHTYENIDFDESKKMIKNAKENVYECIYIGNREDFPETTTDLEIAAKKITDQLYNAENNPEQETKDFNLTKLVFQNVQLRTAEIESKPVGFSHIDDLSEEELNKYLAELEAEERKRDGNSSHENLTSNSYRDSESLSKNIYQNRPDEEDANEAPIFESVTIGELPEVSHSELLAKAKKFPVIDYSRSGPSTENPVEFSTRKGSEKCPQSTKTVSEANDVRGKGRKNKKTSEKMRKTSDDAEPSVDSQRSHELGVKPAENESTTIEKPILTSDANIGKISQESHLQPENSLSNRDVTAQLTTESHSSSDTSSSHETNVDIIKTSDNTMPSTSVHPELNCSNAAENSGDVSENGVASTVSESDQTGSDPIESQVIDIPNNGIDESNTIDDTNPSETNENNDRLPRPQTLDILSSVALNEQLGPGSAGVTPGQPEPTDADAEGDKETSPNTSESSSLECGMILGKQPPFWVPDSEAPLCMLCEAKFTVIKRRHHCRACGKVLCSKCCGMKYRLEYQGNMDSRVCLPCFQLLVKAESDDGGGDLPSRYNEFPNRNTSSLHGRQPNPNNPMEYCSTIPPLQQLAGGLPTPPTVMVPVGVLKREGSTKQRTEGPKSVMFSDGIRPGCDLTELDSSWEPKSSYRKAGNKRLPTPPGSSFTSAMIKRQNLPPLDPTTNSYIPQDPNALPPTVTIHKGQINYHDVQDQARLFESLKNECEPPVMFAINRNLCAYVKITNLNCCVNRICWNVTSRGLACVGQDEVILLVETLADETQIPKDLLIHINMIYVEAIKGNTITELGISIHQGGNLLGSREHAGFLFIRQTFQCLQKIILPPSPFLVGLLVHRWETPWAKVFPLRLVLRLGAEYRYYPCPLVSVRCRDAVYSEIGHTIMKVLADFRNFAYTLPSVRGLVIHMQERTTDVMFPRNRYDQVIRGLNNSNDHVLAFAANFSMAADSHLVCIQTNTGDESSYQTQAINIHNKPRLVTGASFVVINGALKSSMSLSAKSSLVEDGLMVQIMPEKMEALKAALKNMQDFSIGCGRQGAAEPDEIVNIKWVGNDTQFNLGVKSVIDGEPMDGVPSIRVHNGTDYMGSSRFIRWTEVFIIKSNDHPNGVHDPIDINRLSESIARATCTALVKLLDLLATAGLTKIAVRTTIHPDNVGYEAGSEGTRLPPIYMKSLDNELIQVLHKAAQNSQDTYTVLELIFHVLDD